MLSSAITQICNTEKLSFKTSFGCVIPAITAIIRDVSSKYSVIDNYKTKEIILVLTEIIVNAIKHGNKNNYNKNITVTYAFDASSIIVSVEDEGNGFDYKTALLANSSTGLNVITTICDDIYWNKKGNKIVVIFSLE